MDGFSGAVFKGFNNKVEALSFVSGYSMMIQHQKASAEKSKASTSKKSTTQASASQSVSGQPSSVRSPNSVLSSTGRVGSYTDIGNDSPIAKGALSRGKLTLCDSPKAYFSYDSMKDSKRRDVDDDRPRKKAKTTDIEIIDLTEDSPHKERPVCSTTISSSSISSMASSLSINSVSSKSSATTIVSPISPTRRVSHNTLRNESNYIPPEISPVIDLISPDPVFSSLPITRTSTGSLDAELSPEQQRILTLVAQGKNIFFTGSAGVGKSFVLQKITQLLKTQGLENFSDFFITASTGILLKVECL